MSHFLKVFSVKLFHFSIFGKYFKCVEKKSINISYLACCEIELFFLKKLMEKKSLKLNHTFLVDQR